MSLGPAVRLKRKFVRNKTCNVILKGGSPDIHTLLYCSGHIG